MAAKLPRQVHVQLTFFSRPFTPYFPPPPPPSGSRRQNLSLLMGWLSRYFRNTYYTPIQPARRINWIIARGLKTTWNIQRFSTQLQAIWLSWTGAFTGAFPWVKTTQWKWEICGLIEFDGLGYFGLQRNSMHAVITVPRAVQRNDELTFSLYHKIFAGRSVFTRRIGDN